MRLEAKMNETFNERYKKSPLLLFKHIHNSVIGNINNFQNQSRIQELICF